MGHAGQPGTVSNLNKKIYAKIDEWRHRRIEGEHPYVFLDGIVMKRSWAGEVRNVSLLVAIGVTTDGYREILGIVEGPKEDKSGWSMFLRHLADRGLSGVQLIISDACRGLVESAAEVLPEAQWQRCVVHFYRNVFSLVPSGKVRDVAKMLKAIHAQENRKAAAEKMAAVIADPARDEVDQGRRAARGERARDPGLLRLSRQPLDQAANKQPAGADHERDPAPNPRRRRVSGREVLPQPRCGPPAPHRRDASRQPGTTST